MDCNHNPLLDEELISLLLVPVRSLPLIARTQHLLERYGVKTIADLYSFINHDMLAFRGVGSTTLDEVERVTQTYTKQLLENYRQEDINKALNHAQICLTEEVSDCEFISQKDDASLDLSFPPRISRSLKRGGIETIADLTGSSEEAIRSIRNIGEKSLIQILAVRNNYLASLSSVEPDLAPLFPQLNLSRPIKNKLALIGLGTAEELSNYTAENLVIEAELSYSELLDVHKCLQESGLDLVFSWPTQTIISQRDYEFLQYLGVPLEKISIDRLALPINTEQILKQHLAIKTLDVLIRQSEVVLQSALFYYGDDSLNVLRRNLRSYVDWLPTQNNWEKEIDGSIPSPIYLMQLKSTSLEKILEFFFAVIASERYKRVLELRYGLNGGNRSTLQQIGQSFGITRERVRQMEKAALEKLYKPKSNGLVQAFYFSLEEEMSRHDGIMSIEQIRTYIESIMEIGEVHLSGTLSLLLSLQDDIFIEIIPNKLWGLKSAPVYFVGPVQEELFRILKAYYSTLTYSALRNKFIKSAWYSNLPDKTFVTDKFIKACMLADERFEELDDSWALAQWKRSRIDEIVTALREIGKPAHFNEITDATNSLLSDQEPVSSRYCHAVLQRKTDLFVWVGRGTYGLSEWGIKRVRFYVDIAEQFIEQSGEPMSLSEIYSHVNQERKTSIENVFFMLSTNHRFHRYPNNKFGLARWTETSGDEEDSAKEQTEAFYDELRKRFFDDL